MSEREHLKELKEEFANSVVVLTANLLRVAAGSGASHELPGQLLAAAVEYREIIEEEKRLDSRMVVTDIRAEISSALRKWCSTEKHDRIGRLGRGAMQVVASKMMGQRSQEMRAIDELICGIREWTGIETSELEHGISKLNEDRDAKADAVSPPILD